MTAQWSDFSLAWSTELDQTSLALSHVDHTDLRYQVYPAPAQQLMARFGYFLPYYFKPSSSITAPICFRLKLSLFPENCHECHDCVLLNNTHHFSTRALGFFFSLRLNSYDIRTVTHKCKTHRAAQLKWSLRDYSLFHFKCLRNRMCLFLVWML